MDEWSLETLRAATADAVETHLATDAVVCTNWVSFDGMTGALADLAALDLDGGPFVFDPGGLTAAPREPLAALSSALADLDGSYDVYLSANPDEVDHLVAVLVDGDVPARDPETLAALRERLGVTGVVRHGHPEARAVTRADRTTVPTLDVAGEHRQTGAGDRFDAGLAHGLASGWRLERTLALGNLCASYHVEHGESGNRRALAGFAASRIP